MSAQDEGSGGRPDRHVQSMVVGTTAATFMRKAVNHTPPAWIKDGSLFFVTICCERRGENQLCHPTVGQELLETAAFYHARGRWFARLFLLMPDHIHALLAFPVEEGMNEAIRNWKSYTARKFGVAWQRNFFDHRLREGEQWELKANYIRQNPVRQGLIPEAKEWPYFIEN